MNGSPARPERAVVWRIRDRTTFADLRRKGRRVRQGPLRLTFVPGASPEPPQFAYAVGRAAGGAVERNRIRRRLRAVVADLAPHIPPGAYLVGAGAEARAMAPGELRSTLTRAIEAATRKNLL